jgi:cysteine desulfurase/selenocysteine lyase
LRCLTQNLAAPAEPTLRRFGEETTVRPSLALCNNYDDIDAMIAALRRLRQLPA